MERSKIIFGNKMPAAVYNNAVKAKERHISKYGDDSGVTYHLKAAPAPAIGDIWNVKSLSISDTPEVEFDEKSIIVGNIRMGFGHYRISMAIASAAYSMGYDPYWFDLHSLDGTTC
nr:hypothetical protein [Oscillospiraceae bacterium]